MRVQISLRMGPSCVCNSQVCGLGPALGGMTNILRAAGHNNQLQNAGGLQPEDIKKGAGGGNPESQHPRPMM